MLELHEIIDFILMQNEEQRLFQPMMKNLKNKHENKTKLFNLIQDIDDQQLTKGYRHNNEIITDGNLLIEQVDIIENNLPFIARETEKSLNEKFFRLCVLEKEINTLEHTMLLDQDVIDELKGSVAESKKDLGDGKVEYS